MKVLIVDDNPQNVYLLEILLQGHGYDVTTAYNGAEALEKAVQDHVDLIVSDILMPQMDGFQLCRAVKTHPQLQDVPFVFYSATYTDPQDQAFALSLGADKFVAKPQDPRVLLAEVQDVLRQRTAGRPVPPPPAVDEAVYMQVYNARLIHKLEETVVALEAAHQEVAASEAQYRALVEQANDAVLLFDPHGQVRLVNLRFCTWFGYGQEDATQLHLRSLIHPAEADRVLAVFQGLMAGDRPPALGEVRCLTKTGALLFTDMNASVIVCDGTCMGVQAILRDIAERQQAEHLLHEQATLAALETEIGRAMARSESLTDMLRQCTEAMVRHLDAAFARIWTLNDVDNVLELQASAGMYTHLNGAHARVPVGQFKIGLIAQEQRPHLTNAVTTDPRRRGQSVGPPRRDGVLRHPLPLHAPAPVWCCCQHSAELRYTTRLQSPCRSQREERVCSTRLAACSACSYGP
jgi:PAS domain S-box-containing protein